MQVSRKQFKKILKQVERSLLSKKSEVVGLKHD